MSTTGHICNSRNFTMVYTSGASSISARIICNSRNFTMVYTDRRPDEARRPICNSRNFTMVYTIVPSATPGRYICNSRNFTMVYTHLFAKVMIFSHLYKFLGKNLLQIRFLNHKLQPFFVFYFLRFRISEQV